MEEIIVRVHDIKELESKADGFKNIAIFAAGEYGRTYVYNIVNSLSRGVYCFYDNKLAPGTIVRDGVSVHDLEELYENGDNFLIFLAVGIKLQGILLKQLEEHNIKNVIEADEIFLTEILESLHEAGPDMKEKYKFIYDDELYICDMYKQNWKKELNLKQPQTFNDKVNWLKINDHNVKYSTLVDKYAVKEYVSERIGAAHVIPTLGVYEKWEEIDFTKLPQSFVMKCTHDSGSYFMVQDKENFDYEAARDVFKKKLQVNPYFISREWAYKDVKPQIIIEPYVVDERYGFMKAIEDYKFFCYDGKVEYVMVVTDRQKGHAGMRFDFFDRNYSHVDGQHKAYPNADVVPEKPENFDEMIGLVENLAEELKFARIDMYSVGDKIFFGEYTFYPGGGMEGYPEMLGDKIKF